MSGARTGTGHVPILLDMGGGRKMLDALRQEVGAHIVRMLGTALLPKFKNATVYFKE